MRNRSTYDFIILLEIRIQIAKIRRLELIALLLRLRVQLSVKLPEKKKQNPIMKYRTFEFNYSKNIKVKLEEEEN